MTWSRGAGITIIAFAVVALVCSTGLLTGAIPASGGGPGTTRNIALIVGGVGIVALLLGLHARRAFLRAQRVLASGVPGIAEVSKVRETGTEYSGVPQLELELVVTTESHGTYRTTVKDLVPALRFARLTMGGAVPVRVDPDNRDRVLLDWDRE
ncbi:hypothetical protein ABZS66_23050 [Dactylosporangium sp. NPDC005572]|uniref:hypothetical protein n=1 Tax=Dactylosporangium sp. NPDC005572 TaxID=3156889 RepID=UPI0033B8E9F3